MTLNAWFRRQNQKVWSALIGYFSRRREQKLQGNWQLAIGNAPLKMKLKTLNSYINHFRISIVNGTAYFFLQVRVYREIETKFKNTSAYK